MPEQTLTVEIGLRDAEILIAVLIGAERSFAVTCPPLVEALRALRPWRSELLQAYVVLQSGRPR